MTAIFGLAVPRAVWHWVDIGHPVQPNGTREGFRRLLLRGCIVANWSICHPGANDAFRYRNGKPMDCYKNPYQYFPTNSSNSPRSWPCNTSQSYTRSNSFSVYRLSRHASSLHNRPGPSGTSSV